MAAVERKCRTRIKLTEYEYINDFTQLIEKRPYDIYIYYYAHVHNAVNYLPGNGPDISDIALGYHASIKKQYFDFKLRPDTLFFVLDTNALVYDQSLITNIEQISVADMFRLAREGKKVVLEYDFEKIYWLFERDANTSQIAIDRYWDMLHNLVTNNAVELSNFVSRLKQPEFTIGYMDGGEVHNPDAETDEVRSHNGRMVRLGYTVSPKYSHVSADLMSIKTSKPSAVCVARAIASREFLDWVMQTSYFFSPFGDIPLNAEGKPISVIAKDFLKNLDRLSWLTTKTRPYDHYSDYARTVWQQISQCVDQGQRRCEMTTKNITEFQ